MDYEKKYKEALGRAKEKYAMFEGMKQGDVLEDVFPELKESESEDERIRKALIRYFTLSDEHDYNEACGVIIAWLEKQGEHAKFRDSIQIGDKVTRNEDGVLVNLSQLKRVAKKDEKQGEQKHVAKYKVGDTIYYNSFGRLVSFVIANIVEDGTDNPMYEDKDGNSVFQNDIVEQNPTWSEEDEKLFDLLNTCVCRCITDPYWEHEKRENVSRNMPPFLDKLKSLLPQIHWKPSDEQMAQLKKYCPDNRPLTSLYEQLKKLREE